jgi:hypothetical protein
VNLRIPCTFHLEAMAEQAICRIGGFSLESRFSVRDEFSFWLLGLVLQYNVLDYRIFLISEQ